MAHKTIADLENEILTKIRECEAANKRLQEAIDSPEKRTDMRVLDLKVVKKRHELKQLKKRLGKLKER